MREKEKEKEKETFFLRVENDVRPTTLPLQLVGLNQNTHALLFGFT